MTPKPISADYPFESQYAQVAGSRIHYIEKGKGDPVLFLHGNPTWSYLWRNVIPYAAQRGRAIALDLIGMGKSDKPNIEYRFADHIRYVEEFIQTMELRHLTLVIHDWGLRTRIPLRSATRKQREGYCIHGGPFAADPVD